jgi:hypothetical protein
MLQPSRLPQTQISRRKIPRRISAHPEETPTLRHAHPLAKDSRQLSRLKCPQGNSSRRCLCFSFCQSPKGNDRKKGSRTPSPQNAKPEGIGHSCPGMAVQMKGALAPGLRRSPRRIHPTEFRPSASQILFSAFGTAIPKRDAPDPPPAIHVSSHPKERTMRSADVFLEPRYSLRASERPSKCAENVHKNGPKRP